MKKVQNKIPLRQMDDSKINGIYTFVWKDHYIDILSAYGGKNLKDSWKHKGGVRICLKYEKVFHYDFQIPVVFHDAESASRCAWNFLGKYLNQNISKAALMLDSYERGEDV